MDLNPFEVKVLAAIQRNPGIDAATASGLLGGTYIKTLQAARWLKSRGYVRGSIRPDSEVWQFTINQRGKLHLQLMASIKDCD